MLCLGCRDLKCGRTEELGRQRNGAQCLCFGQCPLFAWSLFFLAWSAVGLSLTGTVIQGRHQVPRAIAATRWSCFLLSFYRSRYQNCFCLRLYRPSRCCHWWNAKMLNLCRLTWITLIPPGLTLHRLPLRPLGRIWLALKAFQVNKSAWFSRCKQPAQARF